MLRKSKEKPVLPPNEEKLRAALARQARQGPPKLAALADWLLGNLDLVAFESIRGLAQRAGVDANLVPRLARELGFDGFDPFRAEVRAILRARGESYGNRAWALREGRDGDIAAAVIEAGRANFERVTTPETLARIDACVPALLSARRVHCVGVRSCFSVAHYFAYVGGMAFANFVPVPSVPGAILDQVSDSGPEDIVVAITYAHYSAEVVRACQVARQRQARIIALTDSPAAPVAEGAWQVIVLPMAGPQLIPSLASAFLVVELILASMAAQSADAAERIAGFEARVAAFGGYVRP